LKVRPLEHTVGTFFGEQFIDAHLRDVRESPTANNLLAFVHVHYCHLWFFRLNGMEIFPGINGRAPFA
jgi:hypothetical protein